MNKHLNLEDRMKIEAMLAVNAKVASISKYLGRHHSTIYREINRGKSSLESYKAKPLHEQSRKNMSRQQEHNSPSLDTIKLVEKKILEEQWSPEQISNWLKKEGHVSVSHTWIYQYISEDKQKDGELHNHLRRGINSYKTGAKEYKGNIQNRVSIEDRPEIVKTRERLGDYEIDLIVGPKNKGAILTMVDRLSRECKLCKLSGKSSENVTASVIKNINQQIYTITSDNGTEFTQHQIISKTLNLDYYFAHPYASYERGSIENLNGLVRQYFPKGTSIENIKEEDLKTVETKLNNRPRKILDFLTPIEFNEKWKLNSHLKP